MHLHLVQVSIKILLDLLFCKVSKSAVWHVFSQEQEEVEGKGTDRRTSYTAIHRKIKDHHAADPLKEKLFFPQLLQLNLQVFKLYYAQA